MSDELRECDGNPLQRIDFVRRRQGVSIRNASQHLGMKSADVRAQLKQGGDMTLSELYRWQALLDVPVAELLVDDDDNGLSDPLKKRASLIKLMKTAATIKKVSREEATQRLVQMFMEQLTELMPELKEVGPWRDLFESNGSREGTAARRQAPASLFDTTMTPADDFAD